MSNALKSLEIYAENVDLAKTNETINGHVPLELEVIKLEQNNETSKGEIPLVLQ